MWNTWKSYLYCILGLSLESEKNGQYILLWSFFLIKHWNKTSNLLTSIEYQSTLPSMWKIEYVYTIHQGFLVGPLKFSTKFSLKMSYSFSNTKICSMQIQPGIQGLASVTIQEGIWKHYSSIIHVYVLWMLVSHLATLFV